MDRFPPGTAARKRLERDLFMLEEALPSSLIPPSGHRGGSSVCVHRSRSPQASPRRRRGQRQRSSADPGRVREHPRRLQPNPRVLVGAGGNEPWAIEGCNGVGKHLSQRLFSTGERVVDVSTRRAALIRVYAGGNGRKNDDTDAEAIAMVAVHTPDVPEVRADDRSVARWLVSHRRKELIGLRTQTVCRIHRDLEVSSPAEPPASCLLPRHASCWPRSGPVMRSASRRFIADQIRDLQRVDGQIAELAELVDDTPTTLRDIYGVGVITTALILVEVGNVARFRDRNHFASYIGTAPCDRGSAGNPRPSVNPHGNRRLNHAIHVVVRHQNHHKL